MAAGITSPAVRVSTVVSPISLELRTVGATLFLPDVVSRSLSGLRLTVGSPEADNGKKRTTSSEQRTIDLKKQARNRKQQAQAPKVRKASKSANLSLPFVQHFSCCSTVAVPMSIAYLDTSGAAAYLGLSKNCLERWRLADQGPPWIRLGAKKVRYDPRDLDAWREGRRRVPEPLGEVGEARA